MSIRSQPRFPSEMRFCFPWRPYQERVLQELESHLEDRHFHLVAAPGSGKTVLGLEVVRRLDRPALVLAPTRAIRDQWIRRFLDLFLQAPQQPDWISSDLDRPALLTVSTYQALHAACRGASATQVAAGFREAGVHVLVLDEAHHLRSQWWICLDQVKEALQNPFVISLTATPPYDVPQVEWNRFMDLCGPIDCEISVPELVREHNLCPHQDYVLFSSPTEMELKEFERFDLEIRSLVNDLALSSELPQWMAAHPAVAQASDHLDVLLERSDYFLSLAILLQERAPEFARSLVKTLGLGRVRLPPFHRGWAEVMLNGMLFGRDPLFPVEAAPFLEELTRQLRHHGAISQRQVYLRTPPRHRRLLESSLNKCASIASILDLEGRILKDDLRAVILCDRIRESDFPQVNDLDKTYTQLGVVPVFEHLRRLRTPGWNLAILTGRVVVIPAAARQAVDQAAVERGVSVLPWEPLWHAPDYLQLNVAGHDDLRLTELITRVFATGQVNVIVGTASLLGEGWDAPTLNTLILASSIRAYVSSNQMRGRAIRVCSEFPEKAANVWHLASMIPSEEPSEGYWKAVAERQEPTDLDRLGIRFRSFVGVAAEEPVIENGIERLGLDLGQMQPDAAAHWNRVMCHRAEQREGLKERWTHALAPQGGVEGRMVTESLVPTQRIRSQGVLEHMLRRGPSWLSWYRDWRLRRRVRQIARALLRSMQETGRIPPDASEPVVTTGESTVNCRLKGASLRVDMLFSGMLREIFDPLPSPRYLIRQSKSYYSVPKALGENRARAEVFRRFWSKYVGRGRLIYTRSGPGQADLLAAKEQFLAGRFQAPAGTRVRWC